MENLKKLLDEIFTTNGGTGKDWKDVAKLILNNDNE